MTAQVSLGMLTPDVVSSTTQIPRPREAERSAPPIDPPIAATAVDTTITEAVTPTPAVARGTRRRSSVLDVAVDAVLALALTTAPVAMGTLPVGVAIAAAVAWPLLLLAAGLYRHRPLGETRARRVRVVAWSGARGAVLALAAYPWLSAVDPLALVQLVAAFSVASGLHHVVGRRYRPRLVLAGRQRDVREAMLELEAAGSHDVVAVCLTRRSPASFGDLPTYVGVQSAPGVADRHQADAVVVLPGARLTPVEMRRLHWALAGVGSELCVGTGLLDVTPTRTSVFATGGLTLVRAVHPPLRGPRRWVKEAVERVAACIGLLLAMPALLAVGLLVRLDSPGPAIYRQQRVGRDGRLFTMYKFRSMSTSADDELVHLVAFNEADGVLFKIQHDPRITRIGGWLRRSSLDELPQLWNVVRGDMSLVGPRPALPEEVARYDVDPRRRLVVKPGITGLWQVSGRSDLSWAESVRLDVRYVDNWSLGLDLSILARTVRAVLGHRGAY